MFAMTSTDNHSHAQVAPIAWVSGCRRHKRPWQNVESLLRLCRSDRQAIGATLVLAMAVLAAGYAAAQSEKPLTYVDILHQLTDLTGSRICKPAAEAGCFPVGTATPEPSGAQTAIAASTSASSRMARRS